MHQTEPGGFVQADCASLCMHALRQRRMLAKSKARLRGPFWMNSLTGPRADGTCLLSAATRSRCSPPPQLWSRTPQQMMRGEEERRVYPKHRGRDSHLVPWITSSHPLRVVLGFSHWWVSSDRPSWNINTFKIKTHLMFLIPSAHFKGQYTFTPFHWNNLIMILQFILENVWCVKPNVHSS